MQIINTQELKASKKVKQIIGDQQQRIWILERALDDLSRAAEIAQYSGQYSVIDTYRNEAEELLKDRIVVPEGEQAEMKIRLYTGEISEEQTKALNESGPEKALVASSAKV